jgi:hypothetical protein
MRNNVAIGAMHKQGQMTLAPAARMRDIMGQSNQHSWE